MNQEEKHREIRCVLVEEGQSDVVGLWTVLWQVRAELPSLTVQEAKAATLAVIRDALDRVEVVVGEFREQDFEATSFICWQTPVPDAIRRIDSEWVALGRDPNLGEIAWFVAPRLLPLSMQRTR